MPRNLTYRTESFMKFFSKAFLFCVTFMSVLAHADPLAELTTQLKTFTSFSARFMQTVTDAKGKQLYKTQGTLQLKKPNQLYWETQAPMPQVIIADGKKLWIYDQDLNQVTMKPITRELESTPALLLGGNAEQMATMYQVSRLPAQAGFSAFELIPLEGKKSAFQKLDMIFNQNNLVVMDIWDTLGQATHIEFSQVKVNLPVAPQKFQFVLPKGADLVKDFN